MPQGTKVRNKQTGEVGYLVNGNFVAGEPSQSIGTKRETSSQGTSNTDIYGTGLFAKLAQTNLGQKYISTATDAAQKFTDIKDRTVQGQNPLSTGVQTVGTSIGYIGNMAFETVAALTPKKQREQINNAVEKAMSGKVGEGVAKLAGEWEKFSVAYPTLAADIEGATNIASIFPVGKGLTKAADMVTGGAVAASKASVMGGITGGLTGFNKIANVGFQGSLGLGKKAFGALPESVQGAASTVAGATQRTVESAFDRIPRVVSRATESLENAAEKQARILANPNAGEAIKSGLDDRIINTLGRADQPDLQAYRAVLDLAEDSGDDLTMKARPQIVAGEAAAKQFDVIDSARKAVGQELGEAVSNLSKTVQVNMMDSYSKMESILRYLNISIEDVDGVVKLNFSRSGFSKAQKSKITELYELATEGGATLTPSEIHGKDRMFSQLQREARMEQIGDILVDLGDGEAQRSLFGAFRDVYSGTLDSLSPEIKDLNREYSDLRRFVDDLDATIFKSSKNLDITSSTDPAEFARNGLRRLLSEAQSQAEYKAIADKLDMLARELGYAGAKPENVIAFAERIKALFPDSIPDASFAGGIRLGTGVIDTASNLVQEAFKIGTPNLKDQQRALRKLLQSLIDGTVDQTDEAVIKTL